MVFAMTSKACTRSEKGLLGPGSSVFFRLMNALALKRLIPAALKGCTKGDFLEPPDSKVFDSGFSIELGEGGFDS